MSYKSVWDFGRGGKANYSVHAIEEYPSKIRPVVFHLVVERFTKPKDTILDPFCGSGTLAVEAKLLGRNSINYDINAKATEITEKKLAALDQPEMEKAVKELIEETRKDIQTYLGNGELQQKFKQVQANKELDKLQKQLDELKDPNSFYYSTKHTTDVKDARDIDLSPESVDAIITDIPYANMIRYSNNPQDLSTIEDYQEFLKQLNASFEKMVPCLRKGGYCVIFAADYRVSAARRILPVHADVIRLIQDQGLVLFDTYIWRYYRSGAFRPFGAKPFQAMNIHTYILVFYKPNGCEQLNKKNRSVRYRKRLIEKIKVND